MYEYRNIIPIEWMCCNITDKCADYSNTDEDELTVKVLQADNSVTSNPAKTHDVSFLSMKERITKRRKICGGEKI